MKVVFTTMMVLASVALLPTITHAEAVTVSVSTLSEQAIPQGAQRVPLLQFTLRAPCEEKPHVLTEVRVRDTGLGLPSDILRVYLMSGTGRLTRGVTLVESDHTARLLPRAIPLTSCATKDFTVVADFSQDATASSEHRFVLESIQIDGVDSVVSLEQQAAPVLRTVPSQAASLDFQALPLRRTLTYGAARELFRFQLRSTSVRDQQLVSVLLTNKGSAKDADLQNLRIVTSAGRQVTEKSAAMQGSDVLLTFDPPQVLGSHDVRVFSLIGDVRASRRRTVQFTIDEPSDLEARECTRSGASRCGEAQ